MRCPLLRASVPVEKTPGAHADDQGDEEDNDPEVPTPTRRFCLFGLYNAWKIGLFDLLLRRGQHPDISFVIRGRGLNYTYRFSFNHGHLNKSGINAQFMNAAKTSSFSDLFRLTKALTVQSFVIVLSRRRNVWPGSRALRC